METVIHYAQTRGEAHCDWLDAYHTFSFARYTNPERMSFGALRVLNEDCLVPAGGFDMHPHDNMELITLPLQGTLHHKLADCETQTITTGEIQVISAGTGIFHQELNPDTIEPLTLLQFWIYPNQRNVSPRITQQETGVKAHDGQLRQLVSPNPHDEGLWIYQNAWLYSGQLRAGQTHRYAIHNPASNGLYVFVVAGSIIIADQTLSARDGMGIWRTAAVPVKVVQDAYLILIEVPMKF